VLICEQFPEFLADEKILLGRLILLFVLVPLADLFLLIYLSDQIGWRISMGIVILSGIVGAWAARMSFRSVQQRARTQLGQISGAADLLTDGAMIFFAAGLLLTPGFITDAVGFLLLIPPVRGWFKVLLSNWFRKHFKIKMMSMGPTESMRRRDETDYDEGTVDGEVLRTDPTSKPTPIPPRLGEEDN